MFSKKLTEASITGMPTKLDLFLNGNPNGKSDREKVGRMTGKGQSYTINRMGDYDHWMVDSDDMGEFYRLYYANILNGVPMYFTERCTPIGQHRIDMDFKYDGIVEEHKHKREQVIAFVKAYMEEVKKLVIVKDDIEICVLEKDFPTYDKSKHISASGIHIQIPGIKSRPSVEETVRRMLIRRMEDFFPGLGLRDDWNKVYDVSPLNHNGHWPILGSKKSNDGALPYKLRYRLDWDCTTGHISVDEDVPLIPTIELIRTLSTRSLASEETPLTEEGEKICRAPVTSDNPVPRGRTSSARDVSPRSSSPGRQYIEPLTVVREQYIRDHIFNLKSERFTDYKMWTDTGFCLKNIHPDLEEVFKDFSEQINAVKPGTYNQSECMNKWNTFGFRVEGDRLSEKSLRYWSREDNRDGYEEIERWNVDKLVGDAASTATDYDVSMVVHAKYRDEFRCASYINNDWYYYVGHIWRNSEKGVELLKRLSSDVAKIFLEKELIEGEKLRTLGGCSHKEFDPECDVCNAEAQKKRYSVVRMKLKTTAFKNNIMRECQTLFFDSEFAKKLDDNKQLIAFNNGVFDTLSQTFREGRPDDCISLCTNVEFNPEIKYNRMACWEELKSFIDKILPIPSVRIFFMKHLATCLSGVFQPRFSIMTGNGSNGKSMLMNLMSTGMGDYCYKVNVAMFTQKRGKSGSAAPELIRMKGKRFVMMSEPDEQEPLSTGILKELTSCEKVSGRDLFAGSKHIIEFDVQAKFHLACNEKPPVNTTDGGTWRRLKVVHFPSKFVTNPEGPHQYLVDESIQQKVLSSEWATCFMNYLVHLYIEGKGLQRLSPPAEVDGYTHEYQDDSDIIARFLRDYVHPCEVTEDQEPVPWTDVSSTFQEWKRQNELSYRGSATDLKKRLEDRYGKARRGGWHGFTFGNV
jgi:P4 family phage/plasmid primase-like protien